MTDTRRRTFFVECYAPGIERADAEADGVRAREAAQALEEIEYVNAILVPGDEVVFHVFQAADAESVRQASVRAALPFERIVESHDVGVPMPAAQHRDERRAGR